MSAPGTGRVDLFLRRGLLGQVEAPQRSLNRAYLGQQRGTFSCVAESVGHGKVGARGRPASADGDDVVNVAIAEWDPFLAEVATHLGILFGYPIDLRDCCTIAHG